MKKSCIHAFVVSVMLACLAGPTFAMTFKLMLGPKVGSGPTKVLGTYSSYTSCDIAKKQYIGGLRDDQMLWCS